MGVKHRYIDRRDWQRVTARADADRVLSDGAHAHLIRIDALTAPAYGSLGAGKYVIADAGWHWLGWMRPDFPWALTAMRDSEGNWTQWYFDIVSGMGRDVDGRGWFEDCWLDIVVLPDGSAVLLDEDELEEALRTGEVTPEQAEAARRAAGELLAAFPGGIGKLREFTQKLFDRMSVAL